MNYTPRRVLGTLAVCSVILLSLGWRPQSVPAADPPNNPVTTNSAIWLNANMDLPATYKCDITLHAGSSVPAMIDTLSGRLEIVYDTGYPIVEHYRFELLETKGHRWQDLKVDTARKCATVKRIRIMTVDFCKLGGRIVRDCGKLMNVAIPVPATAGARPVEVVIEATARDN